MHAHTQNGGTCAARILTAMLCATAAYCIQAQEPTTPERSGAERTPWPHDIESGDTILLVYQPQLQSWDGHTLRGRAAVSAAQGKDDANPTFGIIDVQARTLVDKQARIVTIDQLDIVRSDFPAAPDKGAQWVRAIEADAAGRKQTIALDRLEANLEILHAEKEAQGTAVRNDPPRLIFSTQPAMLIYVDGAPTFRAMSGVAYQRLINTRPLIVKDKSGTLYLHVFDGWMTARALEGPWSVASKPPSDLAQVQKIAVDTRQVDLLTGQTNPDDPAPSLAKGPVPVIHVATSPTELIVTDGEPKWTPIPGTQLLFVVNTTGHVFKLVADQKTYVLVSGRWFRASSLQGPWEYVPANKLAQDFANIPDDSPKENVKASVAGTPQAREAVIAATIPETAAVKKSEAKMTPPHFDGAAKLAPITGTPLEYVVNSPLPIIVIDAKTYYAVENGVWFSATSLKGPWAVATSVPAIIYTIPSNSPLHYVTYVKIYSVVNDTIYVGYTPGYQGECVDPVTQVVVYGTGYHYTPWVGTVWYGPPVTYGFGVSLRYTPWTGWSVGFGFGWSWGAATVAVGWGWGAYPWWGPYGWGWAWGPRAYPIYPVPYWGGAAVGARGAMAWGPGGWVGTTGNVYRRWGPVANVSRVSGGYDAWTGNRWASRAGMSYNSRTGTLAAGQRGTVANIYTGRYAAGERGVATNARTSVTAATRQRTTGSAITGREVSSGQSVFYNRNTGEVTHTGHVSGDAGNIVNVNGNVFAGHDGNVYRRSDNGWQQARGSGWQSSGNPGQVQQQLDRDWTARNLGGERYAGRLQSIHSMPAGRLRRR